VGQLVCSTRWFSAAGAHHSFHSDSCKGSNAHVAGEVCRVHSEAELAAVKQGVGGRNDEFVRSM
jgi:hypothetical protein